MATETNETSSDGQEEEQSSNDLGSDEKSQEQMAREFEEQKEKQYKESRRRIGGFQVAATVVAVAIGLCCLYFGSSVGPTSHPLVENGLYVLGVLNLGAALALQIRKNWSRTLVLFAMPLTIVGIILTFTNTSKSSLLVCLLCVAELALMFRQPVLDEYDAPKE
jgi:hypothetical protein